MPTKRTQVAVGTALSPAPTTRATTVAAEDAACTNRRIDFFMATPLPFLSVRSPLVHDFLVAPLDKVAHLWGSR